MNIQLKRILLARGMRTRHSLVADLKDGAAKSAVALAVGAATFSASMFGLAAADAAEVARTEMSTTEKVEKFVTSCLNHGAAYINGELHLCKPANVWIKRGEDL